MNRKRRSIGISCSKSKFLHTGEYQHAAMQGWFSVCKKRRKIFL